jgi:hypothetical protein
LCFSIFWRKQKIPVRKAGLIENKREQTRERSFDYEKTSGVCGNRIAVRGICERTVAGVRTEN